MTAAAAADGAKFILLFLSCIDRNYATHRIRKPKSVKTSCDTEWHCILLAAIGRAKRDRTVRQTDRTDSQSYPERTRDMTMTRDTERRQTDRQTEWAWQTDRDGQDSQADRQDWQSVRPRENTRRDNDDGHRGDSQSGHDRQTDRDRENRQIDTKRRQSRHERQTDRYREKRQTEQTW